MAKGRIRIAACQFAVGASPARNAARVVKYIASAKKSRADVVHFPECALSGYAGVDYPNMHDFDWTALDNALQTVKASAAKHKIHVILGSAHKKQTGKPYNSLYLIGPDGLIQKRYDKRFCMKRDLEHYHPGERFVYFDINGVKCTLLICFDLRFPEIYRAVYKAGAKVVFQSFYNARQDGPSVHSDIMVQTMQCRAATNHLWASVSNASGYYSPYSSCLIRPDGRVTARLVRNKPGIMTNTIDTEIEIYDPMEDIRELAIKGKLNSAALKL